MSPYQQRLSLPTHTQSQVKPREQKKGVKEGYRGKEGENALERNLEAVEETGSDG